MAFLASIAWLPGEKCRGAGGGEGENDPRTVIVAGVLQDFALLARIAEVKQAGVPTSCALGDGFVLSGWTDGFIRCHTLLEGMYAGGVEGFTVFPASPDCPVCPRVIKKLAVITNHHVF